MNTAIRRVRGYFLIVFFLVPTLFSNAVPPTSSDKNDRQGSLQNTVSVDDLDVEPELIAYARKLLGIKYKYGATSPSLGFDCSGFVYHVFKKFGVTLPRSSSAMGQAGESISLADAKAGDIILFTGPNTSRRTIGHVGIVSAGDGNEDIRFIHATSGKAKSVTETVLAGSYQKRFIKVIRVL